MTTLTITYRSIHSKIKSIALPAINWKMVYGLVILLCLSLLVFYILSINQLTQGSYLIKNYNKEITALSKENKAIEAEFTETNPLEQIHDKMDELGFEKTLHVKYVEILDNSMAKAQ